jgi:hypothetical protein
VIHALPSPEDDEFCVRATASKVTGDPPARALICRIFSRRAVQLTLITGGQEVTR